ncbi:hypothetical protein SDJN03_20209, partial [Cucurbita argyrosperma subsp. sororia]
MQIHRFSPSSSFILYLWNLMIRSSVNGGFFAQALEAYSFMCHFGIHECSDDLASSRQVVDEMSTRSVISWNGVL